MAELCVGVAEVPALGRLDIVSSAISARGSSHHHEAKPALKSAIRPWQGRRCEPTWKRFVLLAKKTGGVMETALDMMFARNPLTSPFCSLSNSFDCT